MALMYKGRKTSFHTWLSWGDTKHWAESWVLDTEKIKVTNASVRETCHDAELRVKENAECICYHFSECLTSVFDQQSGVTVCNGNINNWKQDLRRPCCYWAVEFFLHLKGCKTSHNPSVEASMAFSLFVPNATIPQCHRAEPYKFYNY